MVWNTVRISFPELYFLVSMLVLQMVGSLNNTMPKWKSKIQVEKNQEIDSTFSTNLLYSLGE